MAKNYSDSNLVPVAATDLQPGMLVMKVGDTYFTGFTASSGGIVTSDGDITSDTVLSGYIGYNSSGRVEGGISSLPAASYTIGSQGFTLSAGQYLAGDQTFTAATGGDAAIVVQGVTYNWYPGILTIASGCTLTAVLDFPSGQVSIQNGATFINKGISYAVVQVNSGGVYKTSTGQTSGSVMQGSAQVYGGRFSPMNITGTAQVYGGVLETWDIASSASVVVYSGGTVYCQAASSSAIVNSGGTIITY